jgi:hypothetical protein
LGATVLEAFLGGIVCQGIIGWWKEWNTSDEGENEIGMNAETIHCTFYTKRGWNGRSIGTRTSENVKENVRVEGDKI